MSDSTAGTQSFDLLDELIEAVRPALITQLMTQGYGSVEHNGVVLSIDYAPHRDAPIDLLRYHGGEQGLHRRYGGACPWCCRWCDADLHMCHGCGKPLRHDGTEVDGSPHPSCIEE